MVTEPVALISDVASSNTVLLVLPTVIPRLAAVLLLFSLLLGPWLLSLVLSGSTLSVESALNSLVLVVVMLMSPPVVYKVLVLIARSVVVEPTAKPAVQINLESCHQALPDEGALKASSELKSRMIEPLDRKSVLLNEALVEVLPVFMMTGNGDNVVVMP